MKTDEALRDAIRTALDRRLSGVTERPGSRQRMLRLICKEESIVKKKVSTGLVLVIALVLATMSAALATGGFGLLDYKREQAENEAFTERIVTVGERFENDDLTLTVNEAVFNGMTLAFTLDLAARDASRPVYVIPTLAAEADGRTWTVEPEAASGEFSADGFWVPCMDPRQEPTTQFGVEAALIGAEDGPALPEGEVTWRLSLRILRPNYPIAYAEAALPADDAAMTDELTEGSEALFAQAYAQGQILLGPDGSLAAYAAQLPQPDGIPGGEKSWAELLGVLEASDAFTAVDGPAVVFTTDGVARQTARAGQSFAFGDGWLAEVTQLNATFDRVECSLRITRDAPDGVTAAQKYEAGDYWTFAVLAEGATTAPQSASWSGCPDGSYVWQGTVELSAPATLVTFVPCRADETWRGEPDADGFVPTYSTERMVYLSQAPYTDEQEALAFSVELL